VLTTLLKSFFGPLMVIALMAFLMGAIANGIAIMHARMPARGSRRFSTRTATGSCLQFILFVDVLVFTAGYLIELPRLRNEIRSVDPTLLGWAVALACYPPFNKLTGAILGSPFSEFPQFDSAFAHAALNGLLLAATRRLLMGVHRARLQGQQPDAPGKSSRAGRTRLVRHPAYVCKSISWWIASIPLVSLAFVESTWSGVLAVASVAAWALIYVLRALTEEDHLKRVDGEYVAYAAKVRYRFIPGLV